MQDEQPPARQAGLGGGLEVCLFASDVVKVRTRRQVAPNLASATFDPSHTRRAMSVKSQLVTLQLGDFANYVGAHFWNTQDEASGLADTEHGAGHAAVDAGVLYRQANSRVRVSRSTDTRRKRHCRPQTHPRLCLLPRFPGRRVLHTTAGAV